MRARAPLGRREGGREGGDLRWMLVERLWEVGRLLVDHQH